MRTLALVPLLALFACGGGDGELAPVRMALDTAAGLQPGDIGSVEILVLGGARATCERAFEPEHPLDDPELDVLRHALFVVDGMPKQLGGIPANRALVFYAEGFRSPTGKRPRIARGCTEGTLAAGQSSGVTITLSAAD